MKSSGLYGLVVLLVFFLCQGAHPAFGADGVAGKKGELKRIKREMQEKKRKIERADKREHSILADIERIDKTIQAGTVELAARQRRLREAEASLADIEKSNAEMSQGLGRLKWMYAQRVRALYKMGRSGYAPAIFSSEGLTAALKRVKYLSVIAERDCDVIRDYGNALRRLVARQAEASKRREEIIRGKKAVEAKKSELEIQRQKKAGILASVRKEKGMYEQALRELEETSANLWAMIKKAEQEKRAAKALSSAKAGDPGAPSATIADKGKLPWPVDGQIITRFGVQRHPQFDTVVFRRGIEIESQQSEEVRAVHDGRVAYADWYKGYGKLMILEHRPGFYSLYGHLSRLDLAKGDRVQKGQVIGLAGDTGSLKGSKLYFEIRYHGEAQDPLLWLAKR